VHKTLNEIREEGLLALRERLGRAGMIRFLQQFEHGSGNYGVSRHAWADALSLDDVRRMAKKRRGQKRKKQ